MHPVVSVLQNINELKPTLFIHILPILFLVYDKKQPRATSELLGDLQ